MPKYEVEIIETFSRIVEVEAANMTEAARVTRTMWLNSEIILNVDDFEKVGFRPQREIE